VLTASELEVHSREDDPLIRVALRDGIEVVLPVRRQADHE
jgi:hypothetical protein